MLEKKNGLLDALENLSEEDWKKGADQAKKSEESSDSWIKDLIEKGKKQ